MPIRKKTGSSKRVPAKFVLGRERFAQISAVEGIKPTAAMKKRVAEFDRQGLSPAERRREIIKAYRKG
ncbi:hypothetical protein AB8A31_16385 [Tardiphaga sp. 804_B3_N1_9]|uniref:hypothetical protein n=1 Tax=Tardiphaga sp. 804_B3_N1_9 TaxID=3240786 RepID=UPI003F213A73